MTTALSQARSAQRAIERAAAIQRAAVEQRREAMRALRVEGWTWDAIAAELGVTRQAAIKAAG